VAELAVQVVHRLLDLAVVVMPADEKGRSQLEVEALARVSFSQRRIESLKPERTPKSSDSE
jgi:hypothetical protein